MCSPPPRSSAFSSLVSKASTALCCRLCSSSTSHYLTHYPNRVSYNHLPTKQIKLPYSDSNVRGIIPDCSYYEKNSLRPEFSLDFVISSRTLFVFILISLLSLNSIPSAAAFVQNVRSTPDTNYLNLRNPTNKYSNDSLAQSTENENFNLATLINFVPNVNNRFDKSSASLERFATKSNIGSNPAVNIFINNNHTTMCSVPNQCSANIFNRTTVSETKDSSFKTKILYHHIINYMTKNTSKHKNNPTYLDEYQNTSRRFFSPKVLDKTRVKMSNKLAKNNNEERNVSIDNNLSVFLSQENSHYLINNTNEYRYSIKSQINNINHIANNKNKETINSSSLFQTNLEQNVLKSYSNSSQTTKTPSVSKLAKIRILRNKSRPTDKKKTVQKKDTSSMQRVSLLGLFELSTQWGERPEGRAELAAARLAVRHVNERKLLPGYYLHLLTNDTKCDPGVGVDRFFHALYTQTSTRMVMLLGSACSEVTESLAKVVPYWNIVQVSFGSTSPALSDRSEFPLFYRTVAPDSSHNPARIAFIRRFGWDTVTALSQNEEVYSLAVNDLVTELEQANITCAATITFAETDFKEQLKLLRELDTRIIIGSFSPEMAPKIFCEVYELGMFGADYAWILQGSPAPPWWIDSSACPSSHLAAATDHLILVSSHNSIVGEQMVSYSGLTNEMFVTEMKSMDASPSRYAPQTYDAVWAIALALKGAETAWSTRNIGVGPYGPAGRFSRRKLLDLRRVNSMSLNERIRNGTSGKYTIPSKNFKNQIPSTSLFSLEHFDYTRKDMAEEFLQQLGNLNFLGVSGPVSFSGADRVGTSAFYQVKEGAAQPVALFSPGRSRLDFSCPMCSELQWAGGQVPVAKRVFKRRIETIAPSAFLAVTTLAAFGVVLAIAFLAVNLHFRKIKSIKLSSPRLNNMTIVGCVLVYSAVGLLGLDNATLPHHVHFSAVCTARVYLLSAGFSLAFGSMFAKTYRVHRIFVGNRSGLCKNKLLQDTQLISLICALLLIDGLIVTLWVAVDPMQRHLKNLTIEISAVDRGVVYQPQVEVCQSQHTNGWLGALYVYKGLLLIVGVYMAWETRHVKISALNDSQYIGISVYSVVITSGIVVVLANIISERATLAYVTITTLILISTTATLCLLFIPKLLAILKKEDSTDPIIQSMGLKLECNTRRFVTDDKRELQYRVEIQNKVYRREMAALDKEINRLERLLDSNPNSNTSSSTSLAQHRKVELTVIQENSRKKSSQDEYARNPSIGGGLPLLLLSVLPPVIPRASWPSTENTQLPMRRSVTFSSEPKLDEKKSQPAIDLYNLRLLNKRPEENTGFLARIRNLFGSRPSSRKTSSASITGNSGTGIAAALKLHMGLIAGLVPNTQKQNMVLSCNTLDVHAPTTDLCKESFAHSGPTINILTDEIYEQDIRETSMQSNTECSTSKNIICQKLTTENEPRVNFQLPPNQRRPSITHQNSQPVLSFKDRAKGSPRFPHKIVPTCSLSTLEDQRKASSASSCTPLSISNLSTNIRRSSHQPQPNKSNSKRPSISHVMGGRWKSMEDATLTLPGSRRGSGLLSVSYIPSNVYYSPRQSVATASPNTDVWATGDFGIPLSQLDIEIEGPHAKYIRKDNSETSLS